MEDRTASRERRIAMLTSILCVVLSIFLLIGFLETATKSVKSLEAQIDQVGVRLDMLVDEIKSMNDNLTGIAQLADTLNNTFLDLEEIRDSLVKFDLRDMLSFINHE